MGLIHQRFFRLALICAISILPGLAQQRARSAHARGFINPGYLGVGVAALTNDRVKALSLKDDQGVEIGRVAVDSPASKAGLKEHDVITEVNKKPVESIEQFQMTISEAGPGAKINLTVWRNGAKQNITATLATRPADFEAFSTPVEPDAPMPPMPPIPFNGGDPFPVIPSAARTVGVLGTSLTPQLAAFFGVKDGVLVETVYPRTPAERAGLKAGDVITKVNGTPVLDPREITGVVAMALRTRKPISFTVVRNKKEIAVNIDMEGGGSSGGSKPEPL